MPSKCDMCAMLVAAAGVACMVVFDPANPGRTVKNTLLQAHQMHQTYIASAVAPRQLSELATEPAGEVILLKARVLYQYAAASKSELSLVQGDEMVVTSQDYMDGWHE
eukprot:COSAG01_NODE_37636_length_500_cov_32.625935_1_plen_107_part_10